jgi:hypothetical protein
MSLRAGATGGRVSRGGGEHALRLHH